MASQGGTDVSGLAQTLLRAPEDPEGHRALARALFAAPQPLDGTVLTQLLHQTGCDHPMAIFAHEAASTITSGKPEAVTALLPHILPTLNNALTSKTPPHPALLFALVVRRLAGDDLDQVRLSRLHLDAFSSFTPEDRALPYSVMFNPALFGQNRDELLAAHWSGDQPPLQHPPDTLLFFCWLSGKPAFAPDDPAALMDYVEAHRHDTAQRPALRALVLRHAPQALDVPLDNWDMSALASLRHACTGKVPPVTKLQSKPYQALQIAKQKLPFVARRDRKLRVALCISGQLRGYVQAWRNWQEILLGQLDVQVFVNSWQKIGRADAQPFRDVLPFVGTSFPDTYREIALARGIDEMRAAYPALFAALDDGSLATPDQVKALYGTDHVILDDETAAPFNGYTNQEKMHSKIWAAHQMTDAMGAFDLHLRLRPDLTLKHRGFDWGELAQACMTAPRLFADHQYGLHYGNLMIGDQLAIAAPDVMATYAATWTRAPRLVDAKVAGLPKDFTGHLSLAGTAWTGGLHVNRVPARFGKLCEASPLSSAMIKTALETDSRGNAHDAKLLAAVNQDLTT